MSAETHTGSPANFQQWADQTLADMHNHLRTFDPDAIAPSATPPVYASFEPPNQPAEVAAPHPPMPMAPGSAQSIQYVERDPAGRRSPRQPRAAAAGAAGYMAATTALELHFAQTAPQLGPAARAAFAGYRSDQPGGDHPGLGDLGRATGRFFDPNGKKGPYKPDLWAEAGMWEP